MEPSYRPIICNVAVKSEDGGLWHPAFAAEALIKNARRGGVGMSIGGGLPHSEPRPVLTGAFSGPYDWASA